MTTSIPKSKIPAGFTFSQSSVQDFSDCPRRFRLRYIEQLHWPAIETEPVLENESRVIEGQTFHRLAQQYLLGLPVEKLSLLANTKNLELWFQNLKGSNLEIDDYAQYTEISLSCPVGDYRILGKYDLIAIKPSHKALIFDWKTSAKRPRDEMMAARWQTRIYRTVLSKAGKRLNNDHPLEPAMIEMIYWYPEFPANPARFPYDAQQFKRDWSAIEKVVDEISTASEFPMTDDEATCRFCAYRSYCDRGTQAGSLDEKETDSDPDNPFDINFEQIGEIEF